jgi:Sulfotransferase family
MMHTSATGQSSLDADQLLKAAADEVGYSDFGGTGFLEAFRRYIDAVHDEAVINDMGLFAVTSRIHHTLVNRLRFERDLAEHPEILDEEIVAPIVITGLPRSGTTTLQRRLAADPANQNPASWRLFSPAPLPNPVEGERDARIDLALMVEELARAQSPELWAAHPFPALEAEEELLLQLLTYQSPANALQTPTRSFDAWLKTHPRTSLYEYTRRLFQYLQWQDGGGRRRPWVMKTPYHLGNLRVLFDVFPDATVVHCHRDMATSVASSARLYEILRLSATDAVDRVALGKEILTLWADEWDANLDQRPRCPQDQLLDVSFKSIVSDAVGVAEAIYAHRGATLTDVGRAAIHAWGDENPRGKHGEHRYELADYGLSQTDIDTAFDQYLAWLPTVSMLGAS